MHDKLARMLTEDENSFTFQYDPDYLNNTHSEVISLMTPLRTTPYKDKILSPFFDGLIPLGRVLYLQFGYTSQFV